MASQDFVPIIDREYASWLQNFTLRCVENAKDLGLTPEEITELESLVSSFRSVYGNVLLTKSTLNGLVAEKNSLQDSAAKFVRQLTRKIKANTEVPPNILGSLGVKKDVESGPVSVVKGLTVVAGSSGTNTLKWKRGSNTYGTIFMIEGSENGVDGWYTIDATSKISYEHENQVPGHTLYYRVRSKRAGITSAASPAVVVYPERRLVQEVLAS